MNEPIARIRINLLDVDPPVWRRVDVPLSSTLLSLHNVIQVTMGWLHSHLFLFRVGDRRYGGPDEGLDFSPGVYKASNIRLKTVVDRGIEAFTYLYDFGDSWEHRIAIEDLREGRADIDYPAYVDGARRCPPEDAGGAPGFKSFLDALDPAHKDHVRLMAWYESIYRKRFDADDIGLERIRVWLGEFARRRKGPLLRHRREREQRNQ